MPASRCSAWFRCRKVSRTSSMTKARAVRCSASAPARSVEGLPLVKPPYGTVTAINMDEGAISWQVAHGDTPDEIKNNPALKGITLPKTGQSGNVGLAVTKSLVVIGDPQFS